MILKALGINPDIEVEVVERPYQKGDRFILCTDGFWGAMPEDEFVRHLAENNPINKILESTANIVESIGRNSGTEYDNLTAAILEMNNNSILKEKMNKKGKIIIYILAILLLASIIFNVIMVIDNKLDNETKEKTTIESSENPATKDAVMGTDTTIAKKDSL